MVQYGVHVVVEGGQAASKGEFAISGAVEQARWHPARNPSLFGVQQQQSCTLDMTSNVLPSPENKASNQSPSSIHRSTVSTRPMSCTLSTNKTRVLFTAGLTPEIQGIGIPELSNLSLIPVNM
jgi:hypothetical protein